MVFFTKKMSKRPYKQLFLSAIFVTNFSGIPGIPGPSNDQSFTEPSLEAVAMDDELAVMKPQRLTNFSVDDRSAIYTAILGTEGKTRFAGGAGKTQVF